MAAFEQFSWLYANIHSPIAPELEFVSGGRLWNDKLYLLKDSISSKAS